jgi:hypothetical protein
VNTSEKNFVLFPLTHAVECNAEKTSCKHAIIKTELIFVVTEAGTNRFRVTGTLKSEMGRDLTAASPPLPGYSQSMSMSLPKEVEVIREDSSVTPFDKTLLKGERLQLKGFEEIYVNLELQ